MHVRVREQLSRLRAEGGRSLEIANKFERLIGRVQVGDRRDLDEIGCMTRNGEYRAADCGKYDLGSGYRVVYLVNGDRLAFLYLGDHGECFRWIERTSDLGYSFRPEDGIKVAEYTDRQEYGLPEDVQEARRMGQEYEDSLMRTLDDTTLRKIFRGIIEQHSRT